MAVVVRIGSAAIDPAAKNPQPIPAEVREGHVKQLCSTVEIANGDNATSQVKFGPVPSNARLMRNSTLDHDAITSLVSLHLGLGKVAGGVLTMQSANCLMNAQDVHLAGNKAAIGNVDIANLPKAAWELAGYADDPGGNLEVVGTLNNDTTAAGTLTLTLLFATP